MVPLPVSGPGPNLGPGPARERIWAELGPWTDPDLNAYTVGLGADIAKLCTYIVIGGFNSSLSEESQPLHLYGV